MSLNEQVRSRIESIIASNEVVLFMKGTPQQPQCGFSATVTGLLNGVVSNYATVNVLEEAEIREGIKVYSQWPTIPQLYIRKEFVGGCDVIQQMYASGELHRTLGLEPAAPVTPKITVSDAAAASIRNVAEQQPGTAVHLNIDANWNHEFSLSPAKGHEITASSNGIEILFDRDSAARAQGLELDMTDNLHGQGFSIRNPNEPPPVKSMEVEALKAKRDAGEPLQLLDVRESEERKRACIEGSRRLDKETSDNIETLAKDTMLVFHCHHGVRSQSAAAYFRGRGFTNVHNLIGGIDAWSERIDPSVPKY